MARYKYLCIFVAVYCSRNTVMVTVCESSSFVVVDALKYLSAKFDYNFIRADNDVCSCVCTHHNNSYLYSPTLFIKCNNNCKIIVIMYELYCSWF